MTSDMSEFIEGNHWMFFGGNKTKSLKNYRKKLKRIKQSNKIEEIVKPTIFKEEIVKPTIKRVWRKILNYPREKCVKCGSTEHICLHHIIHRKDGGSDDLSNLMQLCVDCHRMEHPELPAKLFV